MPEIEDLKRIAEVEFSDIVTDVDLIEHKLRIILIDKSFVDVYISRKLADKFGYHWECKDGKGTLYRYDNFPDKNWQNLKTFPHHFHNGSQENVESSPFPLTPIEGFRAFMQFIRDKITG